MGKSLFRYRTVTDYSIEELINSQLIGTTNDLMNDPYDCKFYYNKEELLSFLKDNKELRDSFVRKIKFRIDDDSILIDIFAEEVEKIVSKAFYTVCFTDDCSKEIMWSHYSDNGRGFVVEYDETAIYWALRYKKNSIESFKRRTIGLFKVYYPKERRDMTEYLKKYIKLLGNETIIDVNVSDVPINKMMLQMTKQIVTEKNRDWQYENEYRFIWPNKNKNSKEELISGHDCILDNIKPQAIYIGENCTKKDKLLLYTIARSKDIKLYKMNPINTTNEYRLDYKEVTNTERDRLIDKFIFDMYDYYLAASKKKL